MSEIPVGLCQCGCGQTTQIAQWSRAARGWVKGQPKRYVMGHNNRGNFGNPITSDSWREEDRGFRTPCHIWQRCVQANGYGRTCLQGRVMYAHRAAWIVANGPIPEGRVIDHECFQPACVNPEHLRLATRAENAQHRSRFPSWASSKHRGVCWVKRLRKWQAFCTIEGRYIDLGRYDSEEEAAAVASDYRAAHMPFASV